MSKIYMFANRKDAIRKLRDYEESIPDTNYTKQEIISKSVGGNVFRGFHNLRNKPSDLFRDWAAMNFDELVSSLNRIEKKEKFDQYLYKQITSLIEYWASKEKKPNNRIIYGLAAKMVNLLIKKINENGMFVNYTVKRFFHVPFDRYTLLPLKIVINELIDERFRIDIPGNVTMKFVQTPELYMLLQRAIDRICTEAGKNPIVYDYFCWDEKH